MAKPGAMDLKNSREKPTPSSSEDWLNSIRIDIARVSMTSSRWSIFRVPYRLRIMSSNSTENSRTPLKTKTEDAYNPHIVSIGPLHHGEEHLKAMEEHKKRYMSSLLNRTRSEAEFLEACGNAIINYEDDIRNCYAEFIRFDKYELATMILLDSCFMLELFIRYPSVEKKDKGDFLLDTGSMILTLQHDLALLENQIPFFVLERLFHYFVRQSTKYIPNTLTEYVLTFFKSPLNLSEEAISQKSNLGGKHILDLLHSYYLPRIQKAPRTENEIGSWNISRAATPTWKIASFIKMKLPYIICCGATRDAKGKLNYLIPCAVQLREAGIDVEKCEDKKDLFDIELLDGKLMVPTLLIHESSASLFRNLIAYEQCCPGDQRYITSYAFLMDCLIDTTQDVEILEQKRIIENHLGGREDVADLFNNICKEVDLKEFYFAKLCQQVNKQCNSRYYMYKSILKRRYCPNPCRTIAFFAASALLILTVLQTIYTVLGYYKDDQKQSPPLPRPS